MRRQTDDKPLMGIWRSDSWGVVSIRVWGYFIVAKLFNGADWKRGETRTRLQLSVCIRKFLFFM